MLLVVATGSCVVVSGFVVTGSSVVGGSAGGVCVCKCRYDYDDVG